jgi:hypothetical protein
MPCHDQAGPDQEKTKEEKQWKKQKLNSNKTPGSPSLGVSKANVGTARTTTLVAGLPFGATAGFSIQNTTLTL